jgi:hypothetical protein
VYKISCVVTDRYYIGVHSTNNLDDRIYADQVKDLDIPNENME